MSLRALRIGIVCPYSFDVPGGVQLHVRDLAEWLIDQGHDVSVLAPASPDTPVPDYVVSAGSAVPVRYNGSVARLSFGAVVNARVIRWLESDFDVVHLHEPLTPSISLLALRAATCPVVATFHSAMQRSRPLEALSPVFRPSLERVSGRIAVSPAAHETARWNSGTDPVVIPNGVFVDRIAAVGPDPRWAGTPSRPTISFLGRMQEPRKGLPVLLDALPAILEACPRARLLLAGPGDGAEVLSAVAPEHRHAVEVLGTLSDEEKAGLLAGSDVYVAPNTGGESFGIILVEAMAAGAPVVASDLEAFARVLDDGRAGRLFACGDADDLARVVIGLVGDASAREALRAAGRRRAREYDWSVVGEQVLAVYETAVLAAAPVESGPLTLRFEAWRDRVRGRARGGVRGPMRKEAGR